LLCPWGRRPHWFFFPSPHTAPPFFGGCLPPTVFSLAPIKTGGTFAFLVLFPRILTEADQLPLLLSPRFLFLRPRFIFLFGWSLVGLCGSVTLFLSFSTGFFPLNPLGRSGLIPPSRSFSFSRVSPVPPPLFAGRCFPPFFLVVRPFSYNFFPVTQPIFFATYFPHNHATSPKSRLLGVFNSHTVS